MIVSSVGQSSSFSGTSEWFCSSELSAWLKNGKEREKPTDMTMFRIINMRVNTSLCPQSKIVDAQHID